MASVSEYDSPLNSVTTSLRLGKMFSKSMVRMDHIRPYWFTASTPPTGLTLTTVLTMDEWSDLIRLAEQWQGPISATLQITTPPQSGGLGSAAVVQHLSQLRHDYETHASLHRHVDLHLVVRPTAQTTATSTGTGAGMQEGRNLARLFSRTSTVALVPVTTLWMTPTVKDAVVDYADLLQNGHVLVVPTFGFPRSKRAVTDVWPTTKADMVAAADQGQMGILDYHWRLNQGPTSYATWREATEPYKLPAYDYHYGPVTIMRRDDHPWCEERFADEVSACLYATYLAGADIYVLPNDYLVRTGQEPENKLSLDERQMQVSMYKNYRIEQCVFYARQFDQDNTFDDNKADHVQQECAKALGSLRKEKMISAAGRRRAVRRSTDTNFGLGSPATSPSTLG